MIIDVPAEYHHWLYLVFMREARDLAQDSLEERGQDLVRRSIWARRVAEMLAGLTP